MCGQNFLESVRLQYAGGFFELINLTLGRRFCFHINHALKSANAKK
jgi:hypothetical protein